MAPVPATLRQLNVLDRIERELTTLHFSPISWRKDLYNAIGQTKGVTKALEGLQEARNHVGKASTVIDLFLHGTFTKTVRHLMGENADDYEE